MDQSERVMSPTVRLSTTIYGLTGSARRQIVLARKGETARVHQNCFSYAGQSVTDMLRYRKIIRIQPAGTSDWIVVNSWEVESGE